MLRKPPYSFQIRTGAEGYNDPKTGQYTPMQDWGFGRIERWTGESWQDHAPFSKLSSDGSFTSFIVEFVYDLPQMNFYSNLACYDGGTPFCFRCHRGTKDTLGVAERRWLNPGGQIVYKKIECDPTQCDLRLLATTGDERAGSQLPATYPAIYGKGLKLTGKHPPKCLAQNWLLFRLLWPDGSGYAHGPFELCGLNTHSDMTHGLISSKLDQMYLECGGKLTGFRMELRAREFTTRFKSTKTAWELLTLSDGTVEEQKRQAGMRRLLNKVDYEALAGEAGGNALALINEDSERGIGKWTVSEDVDRQIEVNKALAEQAAFEAEYIDPASVDLPTSNPYVIRMMERLNLSYAERVALPLQHGYDHYNVMVYLKQEAARREIPLPVRDIWKDYLLFMDITPTDKPAAPAKQQPAEPVKQPEAVSNVEDAEFVEPTACPTCGKPGFPRPDGSIACPDCDAKAKISSDIAQVSGEQQKLL